MSEPTRTLPGTGSIEVIVGSMYSGKTEELIRRLRRAQIARQRVEIFKPDIDNRYSKDAIVSHSDLRIPSRSVHKASDVLRHAHEAQVIDPLQDPPCPDSATVLVEIPPDFLAVKAADPALALAWRLGTRRAFETLFVRDYTITGFIRETGRALYISSFHRHINEYGNWCVAHKASL